MNGNSLKVKFSQGDSVSFNWSVIFLHVKFTGNTCYFKYKMTGSLTCINAIYYLIDNEKNPNNNGWS